MKNVTVKVNAASKQYFGATLNHDDRIWTALHAALKDAMDAEFTACLEESLKDAFWTLSCVDGVWYVRFLGGGQADDFTYVAEVPFANAIEEWLDYIHDEADNATAAKEAEDLAKMLEEAASDLREMAANARNGDAASE